MTIYTLGCIGWSLEAIAAEMDRLDGLLVDVRMVPRSRSPKWNRTQLAAHFGRRYTWLKSFGNRNYKGTVDEIEILDFPSGEKVLSQLLGREALSEVEGSEVEGPPTNDDPRPTSPILLCGGKDVTQCHRNVLADWLAQTWHADVVHLALQSPGKDGLTPPDNGTSHQPTLF